MNVQDTSISPLHILAGSSSLHTYTAAQILLAQGANPNHKNDENLTPVHVAAAWGNYETLKLLLANGGDTSTTDDDGQTPLDLAEQENHVECINLIKSWRLNDSPLKSPGSATVAEMRPQINAFYSPKYFKSPLKHIIPLKVLPNNAVDTKVARHILNDDQTINKIDTDKLVIKNETCDIFEQKIVINETVSSQCNANAASGSKYFTSDNSDGIKDDLVAKIKSTNISADVTNDVSQLAHDTNVVDGVTSQKTQTSPRDVESPSRFRFRLSRELALVSRTFSKLVGWKKKRRSTSDRVESPANQHSDVTLDKSTMIIVNKSHKLKKYA